ncbi:trehalose-phosphatase [Afifella marina]|uniref:Trehalose 6-phosphate phosphatase n=1 Tax=Afifella marina DSM 2698 TaxID=1120955 RepID=A0A1G5NRJ9_AFIMA|nr:trehalose-phosphatase [Afifella marina]MBK1624798.1 trehalose-phosphatase [Afifella marina DSM 2698]MBK1628610.1 trehalose-phosphatase [Afifella marina]MBK5915969.1 trehalose-phosphatase [Afifella marina]RAI20501.1 trehalose-phosphatase [Afifella marina DSM 2698]SCZ39955.1 trehalose 6-phosphatase [Afifella marina DSM 2698]
MGDLSKPPFLDKTLHALFLDFDGTLVGFADDPDGITLEPGTLERLSALEERQGGAVALISGRALSSIDRFLAPLAFPAAGVHGQEVRYTAGGEVVTAPPPDDLATARARLQAAIGPGDKLRIEDKETALVVHYRTAPEEADRAERLGEEAVAGCSDLRLVKGHAIVEIRPAGVDKGKAIEKLMQREPFAGRKAVFIGDDTTDEDGFEWVASAGGFGIKVGSGETTAKYRLDDVAAVHRWLDAVARQ